MNQGPRVSIITVCYNAAETIGRTLESVYAQKYTKIEHIIVDGGSDDDTMRLVERYADRVTHSVSEPDDGLYHAMNKGIDLASGDLMLFLNADDAFVHPTSLQTAIRAIQQAPADAGLYCGGVVWANPDQGWARPRRVDRISRTSLYRGSLPHQAMFIRRDVFDRVGMYDTSYEVVADYEWCLRAMLRHGVAFEPIDVLLAVFMNGGVSDGDRHGKRMRAEYDRARRAHFSTMDAVRCRAAVRLHKILGT